VGLYLDLQVKKTEIASLQSQLSICNKDVEQFKGEVDSLNGIIEKLKDNLESIKKQMAEWKSIAKEADNYAKRLLAAAESKISCEEYNEANTKTAVDITDSFNNSVRGKVHRSDTSTDSGTAPAVLPQAGPSGVVKTDSERQADSNPNPAK